MVSSIESLEKIKDCLKNKKDFVLNGGAGSGKTYSLVETIKYLYEENKNARIDLYFIDWIKNHSNNVIYLN